MNAVERLWRALQGRDWDGARAQFHQHATVELPHTGERLDVEEYVTRQRLLGDAAVAVIEISAAADDRPVAVHATVRVHGVTWHRAGFYVLHQARIARATEVWAPAVRD